MFLKLGIAANLLRLCSNRWYRVALRIILGRAHRLSPFLPFRQPLCLPQVSRAPQKLVSDTY